MPGHLRTAEDDRPVRIHPTAVVEEGARLGAGVTVGAYAYVGAEVVLGPDCRLHHHATVDGFSVLGRECEVFPYACVGLKSQDLKHRGGRPGLRVGSGNVFREFCTIHAATSDGEFTVIGNRCHFLAYSHVAHDCQVGDGVMMSNNATLAGHVRVDDHAIIGGLTGIHQFCQVGTRAMVGGCSKLVKDVPPFLIADGNPAFVRGINLVGLQRAGYPEETIALIKQIYRLIYRKGMNRSQALKELATHPQSDSDEVRAFLNFAEKSERGFTPPPGRVSGGEAD